MTDARVFLGGEGSNELGSWCGHPVHQGHGQPGVVVALLERCRPDGWCVVGAREWKNITKLRARGPTPKEEQNVLGLVYEARRAEAHVVAFVRDGDDDDERPEVIEGAIKRAKEEFPDVAVIGGTAVPVLEAWMLALGGERRTETLGKAAALSRLRETGVPEKDTRAMVRIVNDCSLGDVPDDAMRLRRWLTTAEEVLGGGAGSATGDP